MLIDTGHFSYSLNVSDLCFTGLQAVADADLEVGPVEGIVIIARGIQVGQAVVVTDGEDEVGHLETNAATDIDIGTVVDVLVVIVGGSGRSLVGEIDVTVSLAVDDSPYWRVGPAKT